jgi:catechol 2,3-dioxygenase-like lactoylglutathione lyase family enzyme
MAISAPGVRIVTKIIFPVADMDEALSFYRTLGFDVDTYDGGYAWVTHGGEEIVHLRLVAELDRENNRAAGYFHVQDAGDWHRRWSRAGVEIGPIEDHPWQMREFALQDPDGNLIRVGQNL